MVPEEVSYQLSFFFMPLGLVLTKNSCVNFRQFLVQALYDFTPQEPGELEFKRGDVITVTDRSDQHWWTGEIGARRGLFPATYVAPYHT